VTLLYGASILFLYVYSRSVCCDGRLVAPVSPSISYALFPASEDIGTSLGSIALLLAFFSLESSSLSMKGRQYSMKMVAP